MESRWYHSVVIFDARNILVYIDGKLLDAKELSTSGYDNCPGGKLNIGVQSNSAPNHFKGAMDDFRIYNVALTQEQITELSKP